MKMDDRTPLALETDDQRNIELFVVGWSRENGRILQKGAHRRYTKPIRAGSSILEEVASGVASGLHQKGKELAESRIDHIVLFHLDFQTFVTFLILK